MVKANHALSNSAQELPCIQPVSNFHECVHSSLFSPSRLIMYLITKNESANIPKPDGLDDIPPEANKQRFSNCYLLPVLDKCGWCSEKN